MKNQCLVVVKLIGIGLILSMAVTVTAAEPNSIGQILKAKGFEWFIGGWEATTDANEKAEARFELALNGFALSTKARVGQYEYAGLAYYVQSKKTIVNTGIDNGGRIFGGTWEIYGDKLVLNLEQTTPDGTINNFVRYMSKTDANTMKSVTYQIIEGKRSEEPMSILEFKRKK